MLKKPFFLLYFFLLLAQAHDYKILKSQKTNPFYDSTESTLVKKALLLKNQVDLKNQRDLQKAKKHGLSPYLEYNQEEKKSCIEKTLLSMRADLDKFKKIQNIVSTAKFDGIKYAPFKSSLNKFSGSLTGDGYLGDAINVIENLKKEQTIPKNYGADLSPGHQTTFKIAMIYLSTCESKKELNRLISNFEMNYPAAVPVEVTIPNDLMSFWFKESDQGLIFQALNVGYVFGGEFQEKICKGIDCSSFVSYVTESQTRLSTMVMEYTARELGAGKPLSTETELTLKKEFWDTWGMRQATTEYSALIPESTQDLKAGDIVIWRWTPTGKTSPTGHAVLVVKTIDQDSFIALECNREDDKSLDGIVLTERRLKKEASNIYVLRRK